MNKKTLILIISTIGIFLISFIILLTNKTNMLSQKEKEIENNNIEISEQEEEVTDECLDEWDDYNKYIGEKIEEASNNLTEDDTHYLIKDVWGYIEVYYLDDENNEYLYKKTTIATDYLSQEDIDDLKIGIEVVGTEAMNKMLEDFE